MGSTGPPHTSLPSTHSAASSAVPIEQRDAGTRFLQRQIQARATQPQITFDVVFGIALPLACVLTSLEAQTSPFFEAGLRTWGLPLPFATVPFLVWQMVGIGVVLGARGRSRLGVLSAPGFLLGGVVIALLIGLLLPLALRRGSSAGEMALGVLVFPLALLAAVVFLRGGCRAWRQSRPVSPERRTLGVLLGLLLALAPLAASGVGLLVVRSVERRIWTGQVDPGKAALTLGLASWWPGFEGDRLARQYRRAIDEDRRSRIADVYQRLTDQKIEANPILSARPQRSD